MTVPSLKLCSFYQADGSGPRQWQERKVVRDKGGCHSRALGKPGQAQCTLFPMTGEWLEAVRPVEEVLPGNEPAWCARKLRALKTLGPWRHQGLCRAEGEAGC